MSELRGQSPYTMKWGKYVSKSGFCIVPNFYIWINKFCSDKEKLTPTEFFVLTSILSTWWKPDEWPAVSKRLIAERCNLSERQVQRTIASLENKEYLYRTFIFRDTGGANAFNLSGLISKVERAISNYYNQRDLFNRESDLEKSGDSLSGNNGDDSSDDMPF